jgi:D-hexose-6-phosphate mutarotase
VTAWQPSDERPVLFTSPNSAFAPGQAIRGGLPIVFPWFGANRRMPTAPQHGFARVATWDLDGVETAGGQSLTLTLSLGDGDVGSPFWPERFPAIYTVTFAQSLSLCLAVQNRAMHPILFEEALHSYFAISDVAAIAISGLAGATYIDKTDAAHRKVQTTDLVTITAETDRVYLDTPGQCAIEDRGWRRRIIIEKDGAASSVVWNPWPRKRPPWSISATPPGAAWSASRPGTSPTTRSGSRQMPNTRCRQQSPQLPRGDFASDVQVRRRANLAVRSRNWLQVERSTPRCLMPTKTKL